MIMIDSLRRQVNQSIMSRGNREGVSIQGRDMADIRKKGRRLYDLCKNKENKFDEIRYLLDDLSEDERRDVVNFQVQEGVSES